MEIEAIQCMCCGSILFLVQILFPLFWLWQFDDNEFEPMIKLNYNICNTEVVIETLEKSQICTLNFENFQKITRAHKSSRSYDFLYES